MRVLADRSSPHQGFTFSLVAHQKFFRTGATMRRGLFIGVLLFTAQREATAQCRVPTDSNEGKLLAFYTAPIVFSMAITPEVLLPASIRIGAEGEIHPQTGSPD